MRKKISEAAFPHSHKWLSRRMVWCFDDGQQHSPDSKNGQRGSLRGTQFHSTLRGDRSAGDESRFARQVGFNRSVVARWVKSFHHHGMKELQRSDRPATIGTEVKASIHGIYLTARNLDPVRCERKAEG